MSPTNKADTLLVVRVEIKVQSTYMGFSSSKGVLQALVTVIRLLNVNGCHNIKTAYRQNVDGQSKKKVYPTLPAHL
jgi:hypothetical protein